MKRIFNKTTAVLLLFFTLVSFASFAQTTVSGTVKDANGEGLVGINVIVKGTVTGAATNLDGKFTFTTNTAPPFKVQVSGVGYETKIIDVSNSSQNLDITLKDQISVTMQVVVTASRVEESILQSPVSIEKMDILDIQNTPADNFYDGLANMKGIDLVPSGMLIKMVNARGFGGPYQTRFVQRFDGMDMQSPALSIPFGNMAGIHDIDVESVEIQPGAASALYGPNAFNGVMNMTSKNPFFYQGLTVQMKQGFNNVNTTTVDEEATPYSEFALRYGKKLSNKFAVKVNFSYLRARDWAANDQRLLALNNDGLFAVSSSNETPINGNAINTYGDEAAIGQVGGVNIHRTGYKESELTEYNVQNLRADATLYYRITDKIEASYMVKYAEGNGLLSGANRYSYRPQFVINKLELKGSNFFLRAYNMDQRAGNGSYDLNTAANLLQNQSKDNATWLTDYTTAYNSNGGNHALARTAADKGRLTLNSPEFETIKNKIPAEGGGAFIEEGRITHVEGQYDFTSLFNDVVGVTVGASYRRFQVESNGTIFDDRGDKGPVSYYDIGGYIQVTKSFLDEKLKVVASGRYDKSEFFDGLITPRASLVFSPTKQHNFRASYQTGFKNPVFQEQSIFFPLAPGVLVLAGGRQGFQDAAHTGTRFDVNTFSATGEPITVPFVQPEQVTSVEFGYKGMLTPALFVDASYNRNTYTNFIGLDLSRGVLASDGVVYIFYENLPGTFSTQGATFGTNYTFGKGFTASANYTWTTLVDQLPVGFVPNFNTPEHKVNLSFGNRKLTDKLGFNLTWRWQSEFDFLFALSGQNITGTIGTFNTFDAQLTYKVRQGFTAKIGGSNIFNQYYTQALGAAAIGGMYYITFTFDQFGR
ncbi:TonB-dependent receptor [Microscilla marina]|uniref:TonB-dependent receptor domain protein n=1 Tax=Microscilla marina ATCC 23134 TaxID=313606 RepID=A1ZKL4_MICM2|nr:TonB-dependent receptor [Microscilla marina]EAY29240.1 TonB-dependent receptor domain protein [Microscilla marina ATCC 23134]